MKHVQGGWISERFSAWLCKVSYSEAKGAGAATGKSEYRVELLFDENNSRVSLPDFDGLQRHADYPSQLPGLNIEFDEKDAVLTITGKNQRTSRNYKLTIFLLNAKKLR